MEVLSFINFLLNCLIYAVPGILLIFCAFGTVKWYSHRKE